MNNMLFNVESKLPFGKNLLFALQQVFSVVVATILLPVVADSTGIYLNQSSALIGAGVSTIIYLILTKFKSPVILSSSFAYVSAIMSGLSFGYFGILFGGIIVGLVYVVIAVVIKFVGVEWINKIMPPIVIGPVVALIGFNLAGNAISDIMNISGGVENYNLVAIFIGLVTFFVTILISVKGGRKLRLYPFLIGLLCGYILSCLFTLIGHICGISQFVLIDFSIFSKIGDFSNWLPNITLVGVISEGFKIHGLGDMVTLITAYVPIAFVSFAEHIADHKNLGSIVGRDLLKEPGLVRTLLGDGIGTMASALFCGIPSTTYGESIGCVAMSKNASTRTIFTSAVLCIIIAFFYPLILFVEVIPSCVVAGICIALYGFISVSGLRMFKDFNLNDSRNIFVVASIFITGIGGLYIKIGPVQISNIACALIVGIISNLLLKSREKQPISQSPELIESDETITPSEVADIENE